MIPGHRGATLKADHRRAIDRYIDFFGDGIATGAEAVETRTLSNESNRTESLHSDDPRKR